VSLITISNLSKTYADGFVALKGIDLVIEKGEILALLGPNGAGKTTLISIICGLINPSGGQVTVAGFDIIRDYKKTRALIGLVPQELTTEIFETVLATVNFSRGLFGKAAAPAHVEAVLRGLSLWDKRDKPVMALSGGMKRRLLIAKALSHEPDILFLDEPTAGVDVELRKDMWRMVETLREQGVTVILTTHYIEEAEAIADRVAVVNGGEIIVVETTAELMRKMGQKRLKLELHTPMETVPPGLADYALVLTNEGRELVYTYDIHSSRTGITSLLGDLGEQGIRFRDLQTTQSSLEDIFVSLVEDAR